MNQILFNIQKVACSYNKNEAGKVLYIEKLDIFQGELIFLLGSSGSGKSTLLETLGLMNDTLVSGNIQLTAEGKTYRYKDLWQGRNTDISEIRKKYFSFIFQNTNLMENFTAYENICLPRMIQQGVAQEEVMPDAEALMNRVGLPENQVGTNTLAVNLSGGQRQRLSFVRALSSNCMVLFCDEPTGNVDERNAGELMNLMKEVVQSKKITAIVVSHDIDLALNHASRIICLSKEANSNFGTISGENNFSRNQWENLNHEERFQFREKLKLFYRPNAEKTIAKNHGPAKAGHFNEKFYGLFLRKEGMALAGKGYVNLLILFALMFFTFLSIGFANGSLAYLDKKLNNAFVNWLTVNIPFGQVYKIKDVKEDLNKPAVKSKYLYKEVTSFSEQVLNFRHYKIHDFRPIEARSVEMDNGTDPLIEDITTGPNLLKGTGGFTGAKDLSLIVTAQFLEDLGYPENAAFVQMEYEALDSSGNNLVKDSIPVGIRSVVNKIPGKVDCAYTTYFDDAYTQNSECTFDRKQKTNLYFFCPGKKEIADGFKSNVDDWLKIHEGSVSTHEAHGPDTCTDTYVPGFEVRIDYFPLPEHHAYDSLELFYRQLVSDRKIAQFIAAHDIIRIYDLHSFTEHFDKPESEDKLSVNFIKLDSVRAFSEYLSGQNTAAEKRTGSILEVDETAIKDKENFEFVSDVTRITSSIIILIGTAAVCLFIYNLLRMHLAEVKMNIGTFTATGLSGFSAQMIYFEIILLFILISSVLALLASWGAGHLLDKIIGSKLILEQDVSYFKINDLFTYITVLFIFVFSVIVSYFTIRKMLSKSPGDLIYNR